MKILAGDVNKILKKYKYSFVMDKMHCDDELKKYEKLERNFDRKTVGYIFSQTLFGFIRVYLEGFSF